MKTTQSRWRGCLFSSEDAPEVGRRNSLNRRLEIAAGIACCDSEAGMMMGGLRIEGQGSTIAQAEKPAGYGGGFRLVPPVRQRAYAKQQFRGGDAGRAEGVKWTKVSTCLGLSVAWF